MLLECRDFGKRSHTTDGIRGGAVSEVIPRCRVVPEVGIGIGIRIRTRAG